MTYEATIMIERRTIFTVPWKVTVPDKLSNDEVWELITNERLRLHDAANAGFDEMAKAAMPNVSTNVFVRNLNFCGEQEMKTGIPEMVTFQPVGCNDVYFCGVFNDPVFIGYRNGNFYCSGCNLEFSTAPNDPDAFEPSHTFIAHIVRKFPGQEGKG